MQFALMIYHTPEEFAMRKTTIAILISALGGRTTRRSSRPASNVGANALEAPETGTTVRLKEGKRRVQDGPYAETKEQLAGFIILELPSIDAALEWLRDARVHRSAQWKSGRWR